MIWSQILSLSIQRCDDCKKFEGDIEAALEVFDFFVVSQKPVFKVMAQDYQMKPEYRLVKGKKQTRVEKRHEDG